MLLSKLVKSVKIVDMLASRNPTWLDNSKNCVCNE